MKNLLRRDWPVCLAMLYLLNPTLGVFEFIPDNIPFVGNLDEATAIMVLLIGVHALFRLGRIRPVQEAAPPSTSRKDLMTMRTLLPVP
jgi:uncharacterized membrane protein YkvA (DUF1232 family)